MLQAIVDVIKHFQDGIKSFRQSINQFDLFHQLRWLEKFLLKDLEGKLLIINTLNKLSIDLYRKMAESSVPQLQPDIFKKAIINGIRMYQKDIL